MVTYYLMYAALMTIFDYPKCLLVIQIFVHSLNFNLLHLNARQITLRAFCNFNPSGLLHKGLVLISPGGAPFYDCLLNMDFVLGLEGSISLHPPSQVIR